MTCLRSGYSHDVLVGKRFDKRQNVSIMTVSIAFMKVRNLISFSFTRAPVLSSLIMRSIAVCGKFHNPL